MDQILRLTPKASGFDRLPPDPRRGRIGCDIEVNQLPTLVPLILSMARPEAGPPGLGEVDRVESATSRSSTSAKPLRLPADHRLRSNDPQVTSPPSRPNTPEPDPFRSRSALRRRGFGLTRESTSSWWRRTRFSRTRSWRERQALNKDAKEQTEEAQHRRGRISAGFLSRQKLDANRARSIWGP